MPRQSAFTQEMADRICEQIAEGNSLRTICLSEEMPARSTVFVWLEEQKAFRTKYARARVFQAEGEVDEMRDIADDASNDYMQAFDSEGNQSGWKLNGEAIQRSKLRLEQRRWFAEKLLPKKYGAKSVTEHTGPDGGPLKFEEIRRTVVDPTK